MNKTNLIFVFAITLFLCWCIISTIVVSLQTKRVKEFKAQVEFQQRTIDSLIVLPRKTFDVELSVSDNSRTTLRANKQSGSIVFPNEKTYILKIDSLSISETVKN